MPTNNTRFNWHAIRDEDLSIVRVLATLANIESQDELNGLEDFTQIMDSENQHTVELNLPGRSILWSVGLLDLPRVMSSDCLAAFCREVDLGLVESEYLDLEQATKLEEVELVEHIVKTISPIGLPTTFDHYGYKDRDSRYAGEALYNSMDHALHEGSAEMVEAFLKHDTVIRTLLDNPEESASKVASHPHLQARIRNGLTFPQTSNDDIVRNRIDNLKERMTEYPVGETRGRETIKKEVRAIAASLPLHEAHGLSQQTYLSAMNTVIDAALNLGMDEESDRHPIQFLDTAKPLDTLCNTTLQSINADKADVKRTPRAAIDRRMLAEEMLATAITPESRSAIQYPDLAAAQHLSSARGSLDMDFGYPITDEVKRILIAMDQIDETSWAYCKDPDLMIRLAEYIHADDAMDEQCKSNAVMRLQTAFTSGHQNNLIELYNALDLDDQPAFSAPGA